MQRQRQSESENAQRSEVLDLAESVRRLRDDAAFLSRVVRQFRDAAIAAHIARERLTDP